MLTDALEIHFVSMFKFRQLKEKDIKNNPLHRWLTFFSKETDEATIKKIIQMDKAIKKAYGKISHVSFDEEELRIYEMRELAQMDYDINMTAARREGMEKGMRKGRREGLEKGMQKGIRRGMQKALRLFKEEKSVRVTHLPASVPGFSGRVGDSAGSSGEEGSEASGSFLLALSGCSLTLEFKHWFCVMAGEVLRIN
jgi:hypothetical protein